MKFGHHSAHPSNLYRIPSLDVKGEVFFKGEPQLRAESWVRCYDPSAQVVSDQNGTYVDPRGGPHTYIIPTFFNPILVFFDTFGVVNSGRFLVAPRATQKYQIRLHKKRTFWIIPNRNFCSLKLRVIFRPFS